MILVSLDNILVRVYYEDMTYMIPTSAGALNVKVKYSGIKAKLVRKGITQADLAQKLGVHYNTVSNWLNGGTSPDMETVISILEKLGHDRDEIMSMKLGDLIDVEE